MLGKNQARKALAVELSRLVLSHETILRHAHTTLQSPELVEIPAHASALGLWLAVLMRVEAEARVPALVESVLDENPGADELRAAWRAWSEWHARATAIPASSPESVREPGAQPALPGRFRSRRAVCAPSRAGALARSVLAIAGGLALAGNLVYWRPARPSAGRNHDDSVVLPPVREDASFHLEAARDVELTPAEMESAVLTCWKDARPDNSGAIASNVRVRLRRGLPGEGNDAELFGEPFSASPRFERCVRLATTRLLSRMSLGRSVEAKVALPLHP